MSEYTKVVLENNMQIPVITEEEVIQAQFPWSQLTGIRSIYLQVYKLLVGSMHVQDVIVSLQDKNMKL